MWFSPNRIHLSESQCIRGSLEGTTRLTNDHDGEMSATFGNNFVFLYQVVRWGQAQRRRPTHLVGQVGDADTFRHCCKLLVDGGGGKMLVDDSGSCLSLFVCHRFCRPRHKRERGCSIAFVWYYDSSVCNYRLVEDL